MDTDSLFLTSPELVWDFFYQMNSSQIMAMAKVGEIPNVGPYNNKSGLPFYGSTGILAAWSNLVLEKFMSLILRIKIHFFVGINSGVILMNLTRLRHFNLEQLSFEYYVKYKSEIRAGDQDILNAMFHFHSEKLYVLPCHYNYRSSHW